MINTVEAFGNISIQYIFSCLPDTVIDSFSCVMGGASGSKAVAIGFDGLPIPVLTPALSGLGGPCFSSLGYLMAASLWNQAWVSTLDEWVELVGLGSVQIPVSSVQAGRGL